MCGGFKENKCDNLKDYYLNYETDIQSNLVHQ